MVFGVDAASNFRDNRRTYDLFTNTTCRLFNYSFTARDCARCDELCRIVTFFDETFTVSYHILNGTLVTSSFSSNDNEKQHYQVKVNIVTFAVNS